MPELWLVRHGETEWSRDGKHTSTSDISLTEKGVEVARLLRGPLSGPRSSLERCTAGQVSGLFKPVYAVLNPPYIRPFGIRATILSKIVHRKRPAFPVLHDTWITTCYQGVPDAPVPAVRGRAGPGRTT